MKIKFIFNIIFFILCFNGVSQSSFLPDTIQSVLTKNYKEAYNCEHKKEKKKAPNCYMYQEHLLYHDTIRRLIIDSLHYHFPDFNLESADSIILFEAIADVGGFTQTIISLDSIFYTVLEYAPDPYKYDIKVFWKKLKLTELNDSLNPKENAYCESLLWWTEKLGKKSWNNRFENDDYGILGGSHIWITKVIRIEEKKYRIESDYIRN